MIEHLCGKVWRKGRVADCKRKRAHGQTLRPQGGWRNTNDDDKGTEK